eukprot:CAMPEP_0117443780 /NCGR_PEP_ID=MMETSP0759-20121206/4882_1 /TAXON_ID=63605 /ORGANISM="Percolomonas cosmopolitus, Strain WS" /LENGTH=550 /DNA_ID=CAMNT_0005235787 /DNA_START=820 /DNA_END=2472 /DNA_ORIENTATION=-
MANVREKEMKEKEIMECQQVYKRKREGLVWVDHEDSQQKNASASNQKKRKLNNSQAQGTKSKRNQNDSTKETANRSPATTLSSPFAVPSASTPPGSSPNHSNGGILMTEYTLNLNSGAKRQSPTVGSQSHMQQHPRGSGTPPQGAHSSSVTHHHHLPVNSRPPPLLRPPELPPQLPAFPSHMREQSNSPQQSSPLSSTSTHSANGHHSFALPSSTSSNGSGTPPPPPHQPSASTSQHYNALPNTSYSHSSLNHHHRRISMPPPPTTVNSALPPPLIGTDHHQINMRVYQRTPPISTYGSGSHAHYSNSFHDANYDTASGGHNDSPPLVKSNHFGASPAGTSSSLSSHFGNSNSTEGSHQHGGIPPSLLNTSGGNKGLGLKNDKQFYQSLTSQSLQSIENVNASFKRGVGSGFSASPPPSIPSLNSHTPPNSTLHTESLPRTHELDNPNSVLRTSASSSASPMDGPKLSVRIPEDNELKKPGPPVGYNTQHSPRVPSLVHITEGPTSNLDSPLGLDLRLSPSASGGVPSLTTPQSSSVYLKSSPKWSTEGQ